MRTPFILDDKIYRWHHFAQDKNEIYGKGYLWHHGQFYEGEAICRQVLGLFFPPESPGNETSLISQEKAVNILGQLRGHYSFILKTPLQTLAAVDRVRSYPVFYSRQNRVLRISNSARLLRREAGLKDPNPAGFLEFEIAGYVTGQETLFLGLNQIQAGEFLLADHGTGNLDLRRYYLFYPETLDRRSDEQRIEALHVLGRKIFQDTAESLQGRPVWIPLSAGLDSRWILTMLLDLKYDNITTFSYGKKTHPEIAWARMVAAKLKVPWRPVYYTRAKNREIFYSSEAKAYSDFSDGLSVIPVYNDFYALWCLREQKAIPSNAVIINGQSGDFLTGGHIPRNFVQGQSYSSDDIIKALVKKHFCLWVNLRTNENLEVFGRRISQALSLQPGRSYTTQEAAQLFEFWEWQERQAKFVVNGQRVYEWFGHDWRLPLWHDELMFFWQNIPWDKRAGQGLHKRFLDKKNYGRVFNGFYTRPLPRKLWERIVTRILMAYAAVTKQDIHRLVYQYEWYFANYSPFYFLQKNYWEYLKDSYWQESPYSYLVKEYLQTKRFEDKKEK